MKKLRRWKNSFFLLLTMVCLVGVSIFYAVYLHSAVETEMESYLQELAEQNIKMANERIGNDYLYLEGIASSIGGRTTEIYSSRVLDILDTKAEETRFTCLAVADKDGNVYYKGQNKESNVADCSYFKRVMAGKPSVESVVQQETKEQEIVTAVPIIRDGRPIGAVLGRYAIAEMEKLIYSDYLDGNAYVYIVDSEGHFLVRDKKDEIGKEHFQDLIDSGKTTISAKEMEGIRADMLAGKNGTLTYEVKGKSFLLNYTKIGINDWYFINTIPAEVIYSRTADIFKATIWYTIAVILIWGGVVIWAFVGWRKHYKRTENAYKNIQSIYRTVPGAIVCFSVEDGCKVVNANDAFYHTIGRTTEEFAEKYESRLLELLDEKERQWFQNLGEGMISHEFKLMCPDGKVKWLFGNFDVQHIAGKRMVQASIADITRQKERLTIAELSAILDPLTGLKNKRAIEDGMNRMLEESGKTGALLVMDLDNFKQVNDTFGHPVGDKMLVLMAECIKNVFRSDDFAARLGGDEFLVFMKGVSDRTAVKNRAFSLIDSFDKELTDEFRKLGLSVSVGAAMYPEDADSYQKLYEAADKALYEAKDQGKGCCQFWEKEVDKTDNFY